MCFNMPFDVVSKVSVLEVQGLSQLSDGKGSGTEICTDSLRSRVCLCAPLSSRSFSGGGSLPLWCLNRFPTLGYLKWPSYTKPCFKSLDSAPDKLSLEEHRIIGGNTW